jgi:MOSC domain-containing protein YiiM
MLDHLAVARVAVEAAGTRARVLVDADPPAAGPATGARAPEEPTTARAALAAFDRAVAGLNAVAGRAGPALWAGDGSAGPLAAVVGRAVHEGVHHLHAGGRLAHALGGGAPAQAGRVVQLNASGGGVPKLPVLVGRIDEGGLAGDRQGDRRIHGRPYQAVSLWSADVIEDLRAEGHGVYPGAAGENVTLSGVDWATVRPGVRIRLGDALVEVSGYATPCEKNARWFVDGAIDRIDQRRNPGWSRAYAWVLRTGDVSPGDPALVEPGPEPVPEPRPEP